LLGQLNFLSNWTESSKKCWIYQYTEEKFLSETSNFIAASIDQIASLNEGDEIMNANNAICSEQVNIEEKTLELEEKNRWLKKRIDKARPKSMTSKSLPNPKILKTKLPLNGSS
jgi:hypothetical protein